MQDLPKNENEKQPVNESVEPVDTNQNQTGNAQQNQQQNSEFAEKLPLVMPKTIKKIIYIGSLIVGFIVLLTASIFVFTKLINKPKIIQKPEETEVETVVEKRTEPIFAYIKNGNSIWAADIKGDNKERLVEIPISSSNEIIGLNWKDVNNLAYTNCTTEKSITCEILSYNFESRSITPEIRTESLIADFAWSPDQSYLAYIENDGNDTILHLKMGTVDNRLKVFGYEEDETNTKSEVFFTKDNLYVVYATMRKDVPIVEDNRGRKEEQPPVIYPAIYIYQVNGSPVDEITYAESPRLLDNQTIAYKKTDDSFVQRTIGDSAETEIANYVGYNPEISPDRKNIAYWRNEAGLNSVVLGVYELERKIQRNILRGVIVPEWISADEVVGIKADSCLAERCLLYEFKTASMVIVDINAGEVVPVDQAKTLTKAVLMPME